MQPITVPKLCAPKCQAMSVVHTGYTPPTAMPMSDTNAEQQPVAGLHDVDEQQPDMRDGNTQEQQPQVDAIGERADDQLARPRRRASCTIRSSRPPAG